MMKRIGVFLGVMFVVSVAGMTCCSGEALADTIPDADTSQFGREALACFFPAGKFLTLKETAEYAPNGFGFTARNGWIRFHVTGSTSLFMLVFMVHTKVEHGAVMQRVVVIGDTAPGAISSCVLSDWHKRGE